jgi:hypothetical protein
MGAGLYPRHPESGNGAARSALCPARCELAHAPKPSLSGGERVAIMCKDQCMQGARLEQCRRKDTVDALSTHRTGCWRSGRANGRERMNRGFCPQRRAVACGSRLMSWAVVRAMGAPRNGGAPRRVSSVRLTQRHLVSRGVAP